MSTVTSGSSTPTPMQSVGRAFWPFVPAALALFCIQLDFFALGLALPVIADDLGTTTTDLQWVLSGYMLALGALMIPMSRLADLLGRKRVLLAGIALFGTASLLCGLSVNPSMLIAFRVFQGVGGAMIMPVTLALVTNATDSTIRPRVLGLMFGIANIGTAIGPMVGGGLAASAGWRWVFFVNVPIALVSLVWGAITLKDSRDPGGHTLRQLDWVGAVLVAVAVATFSLGLDGLSAHGLLAVSTIAALLIAAAAIALFVRQERRDPWPMVSPALMSRRPFWVLLGAGTFANAAFAVLIIVVIIQLQQVRGFSSALAGLVFVAPALATAACGPISGRLTGKVAPGRVMAVSIVVGGVGMVIQAVATSLAVDIVGLVLSGLAFGMGYTFTNVATQTVLPETLSSQASGVVLTTMISLGGIAVVIGATGLELFGGATDMAAATTSMLLWTGIVAIVVGVVFGLTQLAARQITSTD
jgi:EmrB/QacA subfamily drug resistance transporter